MQILNTEIKELLQYPYVVFAREEEGERLLRKHYDLKNVRRSPDIVLQNKKIEYDKVFKNKPVLNIPDCISSNAVAIIPNTKCFQHGNKNDILDLYKKIVEVILENSMEVYLMRHSQGDLSVCRLIKEMFLENDNVQLLENDFSCIEFDEMIKEFQFTVVSRFHGAVHSYKNCVPCITLGWAVKYKELAAQLSQEKFSFDITRGVVNAGEILESVRKMIGCHHIESVKIEKCLKDIQQSNCFNILEEILNE